MRSILIGLGVLGLSVAMLAGVQAGGDKEITLKGKITCAKCELQIEKKCATVIATKIDGKDANVYFDQKAKDYGKLHKETCSEGKMGSVTGVLSKAGDKQIITVKSITYDK